MMSFGRIENLMYDCRMNLYWTDEETYEFIDLREAELVAIKDEVIILKDKNNLYWSYDIDTLEAKLEYLKDLHEKQFREAFAELKAKGVIK